MNLKELSDKLLNKPKTRIGLEKNDLAFELSEVLINLRVQNGHTQAKLAKYLNVKQSAIARLESGTHYPSFSTLVKISEIYHLQPSEIISRAELPTTPTQIHKIDWTTPKAIQSKYSITTQNKYTGSLNFLQ